jgi:sortase B
MKVLIQIKDNKMCFSIRKRLNNEQKNLINTNVISQNELVFSDEYILANIKLVRSFVKELASDYNANTIVIKEFDIAPLVLRIVANISSFKSLYLLQESILTYKICEGIIKTNSINYVSLYNIPTYLLEMLDKEKIVVDSRNEMLFLSSFMKDNNLDKFSSLYYKTSINLNFPLKDNDEEDFISFININKYLKNIYINKVNKNDVENVLEILYKKKLKNIRIYIEQNITDIELIEYLRKINKKNAKINNIQFKIDYSKDYLQNNLMNQINLNTIKLCIIISLLMVSSVVFFVFFSNYYSMQRVEDIQNDINNALAQNNKEDNNNDVNGNIEDNNDTSQNNNHENDNYLVKPIDDVQTKVEEQTNEEKKTTTKKTTKKSETKISNDNLLSLLEINKDTVGWLKVNNTNIDYPVVQAKDNDYYLKRNFKNQKDNSGWIFMDYRANTIELSQNIIIFGHNMYYSGVMFGTLYKAKQASWYKKPENQIIEFDTLYKKMKWKIFSIYVVDNTNDYLVADFSSKEKFKTFLNLITGRSKYNFNVNVTEEDHILTLSTCSNNGKKRLVIHAVLLNE